MTRLLAFSVLSPHPFNQNPWTRAKPTAFHSQGPLSTGT
jgi:hypothetical protein